MLLIPKGPQHFFSFEGSLPQLQRSSSKEPLPYDQALRANCHEDETINKLPAFIFYHVVTKLIFLQERSYL